MGPAWHFHDMQYKKRGQRSQGGSHAARSVLRIFIFVGSGTETHLFMMLTEVNGAFRSQGGKNKKSGPHDRWYWAGLAASFLGLGAMSPLDFIYIYIYIFFVYEVSIKCQKIFSHLHFSVIVSLSLI